jgi:hypothetical protein
MSYVKIRAYGGTCNHLGLWAYENAMQALDALSLAVFTRPKDQGGLGWTPEELKMLLADVRKDVKNARIHAYWPMYVLFSMKCGVR